MPMEMSVDDALTRFHTRWAGTSSEVFGRGALPDGRTSYGWLVDGLSRGPVLDLGCGDGAALALLADRGIAATGVDRCEAELDAARRRDLPDTTLIAGDLREVELPPARFETVISHMALMLVPEPDRVATVIDQALAPGGTLRLVVGRRPDRRPAAVSDYLTALKRLLELHGPRIRYPSSAWDANAVRSRLPSWSVREEALTLHTRIPVAEARRFLRVSYYGAGLIEGDALLALDTIIDRVVEAHADNGMLAWELPLLGVEARKPF